MEVWRRDTGRSLWFLSFMYEYGVLLQRRIWCVTCIWKCHQQETLYNHMLNVQAVKDGSVSKISNKSGDGWVLKMPGCFLNLDSATFIQSLMFKTCPLLIAIWQLRYHYSFLVIPVNRWVLISRHQRWEAIGITDHAPSTELICDRQLKQCMDG